ncbi:hypothetical protein SRB17_19140 [Streptomyces sp. RB17]|uniref:hypothetical protein n=1 Tax=Streptomyces sp. RB17 TaxID=2585197 RepID=UPI0012950588|nr:hypothetical protein [Streptomyces sp. RB17]MQY33948.1 hypothetical protein [Streptomyces sp. RB17]
MRNQRALAAACVAVAVLGFATPVAVADGAGNGGSPSDNHAGAGPDNGSSGNLNHHGHFDDNGDLGRDPGRGDDSGRGDDNWKDKGDDEGNGGRSDDNWKDKGDDTGNGRSDDHGNEGRGDDSGARGDDSGGRSGDSAREDDFGDRGDDFGGREHGGPRNIVAKPHVLPAGGRLAVTVDGCHGGTMSSPAFSTTQFDEFSGDTVRGTIDVDHHAPPGRYDIKVRCGGRTLIRPAAFTVLGGVQGGVGGGRSTGATPVDMSIGAGLVTLSVVGGGAFWVRRRNEKRS